MRAQGISRLVAALIVVTLVGLSIFTSAASAKSPSFAKRYRGTVVDSFTRIAPDGSSTLKRVTTLKNVKLKLKKVGKQTDLAGSSRVQLAAYKLTGGTMKWSSVLTGSCWHSTSASVDLMSALLPPKANNPHALEIAQPKPGGSWKFSGLVPVSQKFSFQQTCAATADQPEQTTTVNSTVAGDLFDVRGVKAKPGKRLIATVKSGKIATGKSVETWDLKPY
jgi:hypothetical protein